MTDINLSNMQLAPVANSNCMGGLAQATLTSSFVPFATTAKVIDLFGLETFCKLPQLFWKDSFHEGGTGYIDGVRSEDFSSQNPIMRGIDPWNRPFIAIKTCETGEGTDDNFACGNIGNSACSPEASSTLKRPAVDVLFQRYSANENLWVSGGHYGRGRLASSTMDSKEIKNLKSLLDTGSFEVKTWDDRTVIVHLTNK